MGIHPEKTIIQKDTCTPVFTAGLFAIGRTWKQPKCPSTDEWIKKKWSMYTMDYYSAIKRNETGSSVVTWMDLESAIESEVSQWRWNLTQGCGPPEHIVSPSQAATPRAQRSQLSKLELLLPPSHLSPQRSQIVIFKAQISWSPSPAQAPSVALHCPSRHPSSLLPIHCPTPFWAPAILASLALSNLPAFVHIHQWPPNFVGMHLIPTDFSNTSPVSAHFKIYNYSHVHLC